MREIKFRVWDVENKIFLNPIDCTQLVIRPLSGKVTDGATTPNVELVQYTGLKDKNGIEIYEGDILEFEDTGEEGYEYLEGYDFTNRAAVCYENGRFELENFVGGDGYVLESMSNECHEDFMIILNNSKIIGNRYENPELLEEVSTC